MSVSPGLFSLDRMAAAVEQVRARLTRAVTALEEAGIAHAVIGGNAVFLWVEAYGEGGERNTPNVDLLIDRVNLASSTAALADAGFVTVERYPDLFLDGPNGSPRTRLRLIFAEEKVRESDLLPHPSCREVVRFGAFSVLPLAALVQTKLVAYRLVDRVHLHDLLDNGLIDASWTQDCLPELAERLQLLIDDSDG